MTEGERVKAVRKKNKLTLEKFGERFGMSRSSVSDIENGRRCLTNQTCLSICREFNVNESWLRNEEGEMFTSNLTTVIDELVQKYHLNNISREIIEVYLNLDEGDRIGIEHYIQKLFDKWHSQSHMTNAEIEAEAERYKREPYAQRDAEFAKETTPELATMRVVDRDEEEEKLIARGVELMQEQFELEKKREA